jgi:hypothetical protein
VVREYTFTQGSEPFKVQYTVQEGGSLTFQIVDDTESPRKPSVTSGPIARASSTLRDALQPISEAIGMMVQEIGRKTSADEVEADFAIKLGAETGIVVTQNPQDAHFRIRVRYNRNDDQAVVDPLA